MGTELVPLDTGHIELEVSVKVEVEHRVE